MALTAAHCHLRTTVVPSNLGVLALCFVDCFEVRARVVVLSFLDSDCVPILPDDGRRVLA